MIADAFSPFLLLFQTADMVYNRKYARADITERTTWIIMIA